MKSTWIEVGSNDKQWIMIMAWESIWSNAKQAKVPKTWDIVAQMEAPLLEQTPLERENHLRHCPPNERVPGKNMQNKPSKTTIWMFPKIGVLYPKLDGL